VRDWRLSPPTNQQKHGRFRGLLHKSEFSAARASHFREHQRAIGIEAVAELQAIALLGADTLWRWRRHHKSLDTSITAHAVVEHEAGGNACPRPRQ
jgi:hypothetical protein